MQDDYISVNRDLWNTKTEYHLDSSYYNVNEFISNKNNLTLNQTELNLLDNIKDKRILHLQCHFGLDTLSLARLAKKVNLNDTAEFICCDIYELEKHLKINDENELFDIVFTSYGTTKWFPDLNKWAHLIEKYLKINGLFIIVDFHPVLWTFDDQFQYLATYSYFNREPIAEYSKGTYANPSAPIQQKSIRWNHSLADIITALIKHNLKLDVFKEFDCIPLNCFHNLSQSSDDKQYQFKEYKGKLPLAYAIKATKTK